MQTGHLKGCGVKNGGNFTFLYSGKNAILPKYPFHTPKKGVLESKYPLLEKRVFSLRKKGVFTLDLDEGLG